MKRILAVTILTGVFLLSTPGAAEAAVRCAAYVGNPCYRSGWWGFLFALLGW